MLDHLPIELLEMVVDNVRRHEDLLALSYVSQKLRICAIRALYHDVSIIVDNNLKPKSELFLKNIAHAKDLTFYSPFTRVSRRKCHDDKIETHDFGQMQLMLYISDIICAIPENRLRKFSWQMGVCLPPGIFKGPDAEGLFGAVQHLKLLTNGRCEWLKNERSAQDLSVFKRLRSLEWHEVCFDWELSALRSCLRRNFSQLRALTLTLSTNTYRVHDTLNFGMAMAHQLPKVSVYTLSETLPNLRYLALRNFPFMLDANTFVPGSGTFPIGSGVVKPYKPIDLSNLHTLKLRNCLGTGRLVQAMKNPKTPLQLRSLEIMVDAVLPPQNDDEILAKEIPALLNSFTGLQEFCLLFYGSDRWREISGSILKHRATLKHLVTHQRYFNPFQDCYRPFLPSDNNLTSENGPLMSRTFHVAIKLETLGTSNSPGLLWACLQPMKVKPSYRIIHMRRSRENNEFLGGFEGILQASERAATRKKHGMDSPSTLVDEMYMLNKDLPYVAQQMFGPNGLPKLQILAYGDFSYGSRFEDSSILLCRNDVASVKSGKAVRLNFRKLRPEDLALQDLLSRHMPTLEACPVDSVSW